MTVISSSVAERRQCRCDGFVVDPVRRLSILDGEPVLVTPKSGSQWLGTALSEMLATELAAGGRS